MLGRSRPRLQRRRGTPDARACRAPAGQPAGWPPPRSSGRPAPPAPRRRSWPSRRFGSGRRRRRPPDRAGRGGTRSTPTCRPGRSLAIPHLTKLTPLALPHRVQVAVPAHSSHGQRLLDAHGLSVDLAQGEVDRLLLRAQAIAAHHARDQVVVDVDVGATHIHHDTPESVYAAVAGGSGRGRAPPVARRPSQATSSTSQKTSRATWTTRAGTATKASEIGATRR